MNCISKHMLCQVLITPAEHCSQSVHGIRYPVTILGHGHDLLKMYLHQRVHGYILRFYDKGFHWRNGGFLKNGFAVSYARTVGTRRPEYSIKSLLKKLASFISF